VFPGCPAWTDPEPYHERERPQKLEPRLRRGKEGLDGWPPASHTRFGKLLRESPLSEEEVRGLGKTTWNRSVLTPDSWPRSTQHELGF
jgi:hypothetical protein